MSTQTIYVVELLDEFTSAWEATPITGVTRAAGRSALEARRRNNPYATYRLTRYQRARV